MPKQDPATQEKKPEEIEVVPSEVTNAAEVEVDLEKKGDAVPDPSEKLRNQMFYEMRQTEKKILERQKQMMEEFYHRMNQRPQSQEQPTAGKLDDFEAEVERIAQTDWRKAVDMRAERIAQEKYEKLIKASEEQRKQDENRQSAMRIEARGREKVVSEFPNIMDESSPEFKAYMEIYNREASEDPQFIYNPRKHEIVLPELREKLKGVEIDSQPNPEIERLKRVAAGSSTPTRPASEPKKIMLTQEEIAMCKKSGISIEAYARSKKMGNSGFKEGVTLDA